jgi:hypothetical protein
VCRSDTRAPVIDVLDALDGIGAVQAAESSTEPTLATINARFASMVAELRITRAVLLAAQHQADAKIHAQDVQLSAFGDAIARRHR